MKVLCPNCKKVYQVDDSKIPDSGVNVKCKCEAKFFVKKDSWESEEEQKIQDESRAEEKCPRCSHNRKTDETECPSCGVIYEKYKEKPIIQEESKSEEALKAEKILILEKELKKAEEALIAAQEKQKIQGKSESDLSKQKKKLKLIAVTVALICVAIFLVMVGTAVRSSFKIEKKKGCSDDLSKCWNYGYFYHGIGQTMDEVTRENIINIAIDKGWVCEYWWGPTTEDSSSYPYIKIQSEISIWYNLDYKNKMSICIAFSNKYPENPNVKVFDKNTGKHLAIWVYALSTEFHNSVGPNWREWSDEDVQMGRLYE